MSKLSLVLRRILGPLLVLVSLSALALTLTPAQARAHPGLDEAKRLASDLEFEESLSAFDKALASGTLTREELIVLLSERAFVFHALRRKEDLIKDFLWLSALAPEHRLDLRAPPDLTATWTSVRDQGRGALKVELSAYANGDGSVDARASLTGTVPDEAKPRLWLRRDDGAFQLLAEPELHESTPSERELSFYADALLLGGVVLNGEHDASGPLRVVPGNAQEPREGQSSWASRHKGWLIGGAAVLAAAVVVTAVLLSRPGESRTDKTNLKPMVTF